MPGIGRNLLHPIALFDHASILARREEPSRRRWPEPRQRTGATGENALRHRRLISILASMGHVEVGHVSHVLPNGRVLLDDVSFRVGDGAVAALVGPNGAGKTTLLRLIAGDITPQGGTVSHSGGLGVMRQFIGGIRDVHQRLRTPAVGRSTAHPGSRRCGAGRGVSPHGMRRRARATPLRQRTGRLG